MEYITLISGDKIPAFGLGTWDLRGKTCEEVIPKAVELGYRLIDTAQMYENEKQVGIGIRNARLNRKELFVTTKIFRPDLTYIKAKEAVDRSLDNLNLDYIDLMLIHEPYDSSEEMYKALEEAVDCGKIRNIGISNFNKKKYLEFIKCCRIIPAVNQVEGHIYHMQSALRKTVKDYGTVLQAWAPFTEGRRNIFSEPVLKEIAEKYSKTPGQIALKFLVQNGFATIAKSQNVDRLKENIDIFDFCISSGDLAKIEKINTEKSLFGWY